MGAQSWDLDVDANATTDPTVPAHDGASARTVPDLVRGVMAGVAALRDDQGGALSATPTPSAPNSFTVATHAGVTSLRAGLALVVVPLATNTDACFLNVDGTGPLPWVDGAGTVFAAGRLRALRPTSVIFDAVNKRWVSDYDGNLDNTPDAQKPVSAAQLAALALKQNVGAPVLQDASTAEKHPWETKVAADDTLYSYAIGNTGFGVFSTKQGSLQSFGFSEGFMRVKGARVADTTGLGNAQDNPGGSILLKGSGRDPTYRPFGAWLKRLDDYSGLYNLEWASFDGIPVPMNGIDDDSVGIQQIIDKFGCRLFNPGRYVNIKTRGLVYEGGGAVIMGANPEFSIFARNIALQTLESVTIPYPISGPVTSTRGVAAIRLGSRTDRAKAAGRGLVQGIRWEHPGRLLGALVGNETLAGQLSNSEAMLEVWGGAGFTVEDCQQGGAVYTYAFYGGDSKRMLRCRSLAQIWEMQEGQAAVLLAHGGTAHGAGTSFWADSCTLYGGATTVPQTYTVQDGLTQASAVASSASNVAVTTTRRAGPLCIFEIQSQEDFQILDCFSSAADRYNIKIAAVRPDDILLNGSILGGDHDESNEANIATFCQGANFPSLRRLTIANTRLNGQLIGKRAIDINGDSGFTSVAFLQIINILTTAHLGGAVRISGADGGFLRASMICGYNFAGNDMTSPSNGRLSDVSGIDIVGQTENFRTEDVTFIGGVNDTSSAGKAQIGYLDETIGRNNTYTGLKSVGLKTGGRSVWSGTKFVEDTAP